MKRLLAMAVTLVGASVVLADVAPAPGFKRVPLEHKVTTEKDYPEYVFYTVTVRGDKVVAVKLDSKTPATITVAGGGAGGATRLVAVPKDAHKRFEGQKEFLTSIAKDKVPGAIFAKTAFRAFNDVKESDPRKTIEVEYKIEKIDPKEGIVYASDKDAKDAPPVKPGSQETDDEEPAPIVYTPKSGTWVAGLAGTAAVVFGGLWIARRGRRELA